MKENTANIVNTADASWNQSSWTNISVQAMVFLIPHSGWCDGVNSYCGSHARASFNSYMWFG